MLTKENALKLVDYMPAKVPVDGVIEIFYKLERMEEKQHVNKNDNVIDWEELKKEIELWHNNIPPNINNLLPITLLSKKINNLYLCQCERENYT